MRVLLFKQRIALVIMLLGAISSASIAQVNFVPGYIINHKQDTIHGLIDYKNWERNPHQIQFRVDSSGPVFNYMPLDISEFGTQDQIYVSAVVETEVSSRKTENLEKYQGAVIEKDTVFLQTLVKGPKSLYFYKDPDGIENFYFKTDSAYELLIYKRFIKKDKGGYHYVVDNKKYIGQLAYYLSDCNDIQAKLEKLPYKSKNMTRLFDYYYDCTDAEMIFEQKRNDVLVEGGLLAGFSISDLKFDGLAEQYLIDQDFRASTNFSGGLYLDIILPFVHQKWSFYNELIYSSYVFDGYYEIYNNDRDYIKSSYKIGATYIRINSMIRYKYPVGRFFIYVNGGISNGFARNVVNNQKMYIQFYSTSREKEKPVFNNYLKYEQAFNIGLGVKYKRYSVETRYELGSGMSSYSIRKSFIFFLGFKF